MNKELLNSVISEDENLSEDEKSELIRVLNNDVNKLSQKQVETILKLFRENSGKFYSSSLFPCITPGLLPDLFGDVMNWLDRLFDE